MNKNSVVICSFVRELISSVSLLKLLKRFHSSVTFFFVEGGGSVYGQLVTEHSGYTVLLFVSIATMLLPLAFIKQLLFPGSRHKLYFPCFFHSMLFIVGREHAFVPLSFPSSS